jgi:oxalate decarboxylase
MKHKFDLKKGVLKKCKGGYRQLFNSLHNMAIATIVLEERGVREPHWHPNANELTYCFEGKALITMFSPQNKRDSFTLNAGELVHIPRGYLHHIENIHPGKSRFILAYDTAKPEDLDLSQSIDSMSSHVLAATFGTPEEVFDKLKTKDRFIFETKSVAKEVMGFNPHKINLEAIAPQIKTHGGLARTATVENFPALKTLALFSLRINEKGIREPHWHPNATELNLVLAGKAELTILSPGGKKDTFTLGVGQGSVIPAGYFHHIENIGEGELHMTVYFNNHAPDDIGISGALSAYPKELLAALFSADVSKIHEFKKDRMIVDGG